MRPLWEPVPASFIRFVLQLDAAVTLDDQLLFVSIGYMSILGTLELDAFLGLNFPQASLGNLVRSSMVSVSTAISYLYFVLSGRLTVRVLDFSHQNVLQSLNHIGCLILHDFRQLCYALLAQSLRLFKIFLSLSDKPHSLLLQILIMGPQILNHKNNSELPLLVKVKGILVQSVHYPSLMEASKLFQILNEIIQFYSSQALTISSLDRFLTLQIITQCEIDVGELNLTKAELAVLKKLTACKYSPNPNSNLHKPHPSPLPHNSHDHEPKSKLSPQQRSQSSSYSQGHVAKFTVIALHEHGATSFRLQKTDLTKNLMRKVENILIMESSLTLHNNLLHFEPQQAKGIPIIIIPISQVKRIRQESEDEKQKLYNHLLEEMQKFLSICDIFYGHLNLRVCLYEEPIGGEVATGTKLANLINTSISHQGSEDDLDILLREQIPQNAYIRLIRQCGNRVSRQHIKSNSQSYRIITDGQNKLYSFRVLNQANSRNSLSLATDLFLIWVLVDGRPLLRLLPSVNSSKNKSFTNFRNIKAGARNDRFIEKRSLLGCTLFEMEEKITQTTPVTRQIITQSNENDDEDRSFPLDSDSEGNREEENRIQGDEKQIIDTYIINLDKNLKHEQQDRLIEQQLVKIMGMVLKDRKHQYQRMEINRNMALVKRLATILQVDEKDLHQVIFLNKL